MQEYIISELDSNVILLLKKINEIDPNLLPIKIPVVTGIIYYEYIYNPVITDFKVYMCCLLFSVITPHKLFTVLCNMLLENSVIFVSENMSLLTSSVLGCCSLLSPFYWQHAIIPILPDSFLEILEAPISFYYRFVPSTCRWIKIAN